jgi:hypothetical protein
LAGSVGRADLHSAAGKPSLSLISRPLLNWMMMISYGDS